MPLSRLAPILLVVLLAVGMLITAQDDQHPEPGQAHPTTATRQQGHGEDPVAPAKADLGEPHPHVDDAAHDTASSDHHEGGEHPSHGITHQMMVLILQLGLIVVCARLGGEIFERFLKQPAVLGELVSGMLIGPYALGPHIAILSSGPLFPLLDGTGLPVSTALYGVATVASIILLFMVGLETDFYQFMRYAGPGAAVGVGGVIASFVTGDLLYVWYSGENFMSPAALFMGTVSTATSVGITARVLSEKKKLDSAEGTTILAGAVIDDVLGILILAVVGGIAAAETMGGDAAMDWSAIGWIAIKAIGFWLGATALGIIMSARIAAFMSSFHTIGSRTALGFGFALILAGVAETFGLAMIIGAYIMGLALSREEISHVLEQRLTPVYACLVPIFFSVMGMLVNFEAMGDALAFGLLYSLVAVISKVLGGGLPCFLVGFTALGAARVGIGMLPRGEVALIVAGVGMSQGYIGQEMFGVVIMMTLVTTVLAPPILVTLFNKPQHGHRALIATAEDHGPEKLLTIDSLTWPNHGMLISCFKQAFRDHGFSLKTIDGEKGVYHFTGVLDDEKISVALHDLDESIALKTSARHHDVMREIVTEARDEARHRVNALEIKETDLPH